VRITGLSIWFAGMAGVAIVLIAPHASALPIPVDREPEIIDTPAFLLGSECQSSACVDSSVFDALHPIAPGLTMPTQPPGLVAFGSPTMTTGQWQKSVSICYTRNTREKCRKSIDTSLVDTTVTASVPEPGTVLLLAAGLLGFGLRRLA